jgi:hypothetical protein
MFLQLVERAEVSLQIPSVVDGIRDFSGTTKLAQNSMPMPTHVSWFLQATHNVEQHAADSGFDKFQFHNQRRRWIPRSLGSFSGSTKTSPIDGSCRLRSPYEWVKCPFIRKVFHPLPTHL